MLKRLERMISFFMRITTGVVFVAAVFITVFWGWETDLGVEILWQILAVSAVTSLGSLMYPCEGEKEISKLHMMALNVIYFVYVNIVVLGFGWKFGWFHFSDWKEVAGMVATVAFVYVMVALIEYFLHAREAEKMNQKLLKREE